MIFPPILSIKDLVARAHEFVGRPSQDTRISGESGHCQTPPPSSPSKPHNRPLPDAAFSPNT